MPLARIRGLILDREHRVLVDAHGLLPELTSEWPDRPLLAFQAFARETLAIAVPSCSGSREPRDGRGPRDFLFLVERSEAPTPAMRWLPIGQAASEDSVWDAYIQLVLAGWEPPSRNLVVFAFGHGAEMASRLAHLVTCGTKRGTAGWVTALERSGDAIPVPGLISLVTDGFGVPRCAICTLEVRRIRFADVDKEFAALEGEGDLTLEDWRQGHQQFFGAEADKLKLVFDDDQLILLERFRVIHVVGRADA